MCTVDQHTCTPTSKRLTTFGSSGSRQQFPETTARETTQLRVFNTAFNRGKLLWIFQYIHTYTYIYIYIYIYTQNVWYSWFPKILRCGTFNFAASTISSTSRGLRIDTEIEFLKAEGEEAVRWKLEVVGICRSVSKCLGPNFRDFQSASVLGEHHTWDPLEHHWLVIWAWLKWWPTEDSYRESTRNLGFLGSIHIPQRGITPINQPLIGQYKSYIIHI